MHRNSFSFLQYNFLNGWIYYYYNSLSLFSGFNKCPFQLLRSFKRYEENKSKIEQERIATSSRPTPWMQESVSMHKSRTPFRHSRMNQARTKEEEREGNRKDGCQEADGKKGSPTKQKHIWGTKTRPTWWLDVLKNQVYRV